MGSTDSQVTGSAVVASMVVNSCVSLINMSSAQSIFASMNQIQLLMLLSLFGVELPRRLIEYLQSLNIMLMSFDVPSIPFLRFLSVIFEAFDYPQKNANLDLVGVSSGSTFINALGTLCTLAVMATVHLVVWLLFLRYRRNSTGSRVGRCLKKLNSSFLFDVYIRLMIESSLIMMLSSISEMYHSDVGSGVKLRSTVFAGVVLFLLFCMMLIVFTNWCQTAQRDHFNCEVKENFACRSYAFMALTRLLAFSTI